MKTYPKYVYPKKVDGEYFSVDVITVDENNVLNIGFYSYDKEDWIFHADTLVDYNEKGHEMNFVWMYQPECLQPPVPIGYKKVSELAKELKVSRQYIYRSEKFLKKQVGKFIYVKQLHP